MSTENNFVHLHTHSHYSLLNAIPTPEELAEAAVNDKQSALALTDDGVLYGAIDFYKHATKAGIKPIIGIDAYLAPRTRFDKEATLDRPQARLVLLAKGEVGYKNLIKLVTLAHTEGFYYKPRLDYELLKTYADDLVCLIPSFAGETSRELKNNDLERATEKLDWYRRVYGDNCYLELTHHPEIIDHQDLQAKIVKLSEAEGVPLVAAHDVYYLKPEDRVARETLIKIRTGSVVDTTEEQTEDFSFITAATAAKYFKSHQVALDATLEVADKCQLEMSLGDHWYFPDYKIDSGKDPDQELRDLTYKGITWRDKEPAAVKDRIEYELGVIKDKGYATYFLVVGDLMREARERKILTTIRGSVAGSLVTYLLGITNVDPIEYKLPFERFLNPERPSAPDIDMDFADNRRDEMIDYAKEKYGANNVAQIGTFGTMMARAAVRDVARALGHPYRTGDQIAKLIPFGSQGFPMTINRALKIEPDLKKAYREDTDTKDIIDLAKKIEGRVRHVGVHAAGVVIAPKALENFVPVQLDNKTGKYITQYEMHSVGEDGVGLLKFDFLGITNLSTLSDAVKLVEKIYGQVMDIEDIPLDDEKTFAMLARGETMGVFQLSGSGCTSFLKQLKPTSIHDINAMVALYRPGPMESIPQYIERKHNQDLISYLDPRLKKILDRSYGVITYQDDVLMIARELAGYSWLEADMLRKAMGKKIPKVMEAEKQKLLDGFRSYGKLSVSVSEKLWQLIEPFAAYGFNKAHAASYGLVAYQTAYMKANYPVVYMSAVLTSDSGDTEKVSEIIHECKQMKIEVLPPDINESFEPFSVIPSRDDKPEKIRFGLNTIKNFGGGLAEIIVKERKRGGNYESLADFMTRINDKNLNKKSLEALVMSGAFDSLADRNHTLANLDLWLELNKAQVAKVAAAQDSLFGDTTEADTLNLTDAPPATPEQKLAWEKELLGVYVSGHPLDAFQEELAKRPTIADIKSDERNGIPVITAGIVETVKELLTKKGDKMAFVKLANHTDSIEMTAFPETFRAHQNLLEPQACIAVKGELNIRNGEPTILINRIRAMEIKAEKQL